MPSDQTQGVPEMPNIKNSLNKAFRGQVGFTCPSYEASAGSKRCTHYLDGGACNLPSQFMCVEWLAANGKPVPQASTVPAARAPFRLKVQQAAPSRAPAALTAPSATSAPTPPPAPAIAVALPERTPRAPIAADDLAGFTALGIEVQLDVGGAQVALVPEYTKQDRIELSIEHAATLRRLLDAFPGARIARFARTTNSEEIRHG